MHRCFIVFIVCSVQLLAADWPFWRGPDRNGISSETGWRVNDPPVLDWTIHVGEGWSAVSSSGGRLYTMGNIRGRDIVYCLDEKSGEEIWRFDYVCDAGNYPGPRSTPVVDGGRVYTISREGHLFCLNAGDGKLRWQRHLVKDYGSVAPRWGFSGSAVIAGESVLLNANQSGVALNKNTGALMWKSQAGTGGYAAPVPYHVNGKNQIALFGEKDLFGVDAESGKRLWSVPWITDWNVNAADPLFFDGKLFISSGYQSGCALIDVSVNPPRTLWTNKSVSAQFSSAVYLKGHIYASDGQTGRRGAIVCLNAATGKEVWSQKDRFNALTASDGKLIILNESGQLIVSTADPGSYEELFRGEVIASSRKYPCWTAPVLTNGRIYLRNGAGDIVSVRVGSD